MNYRSLLALISAFLLMLLSSCITKNYYDNTTVLYQVDSGEDNADTRPDTAPDVVPGVEDNSDTGWVDIDPPEEMAPTTTPEELGLAPFDGDGVVYWADASQGEVTQMNTDFYEGDWGYGGLYSVDDEGESATCIDHLFVRSLNGEVADFGKVQGNVVGQSSGYPWTSTTIPNLSLDSNEFESGQYFDYTINMDHLRLNNGQVGSLFGEPMAFELWHSVGYAISRYSFGFLGGTPYQNAEILIPMVVVEVYKPSFCNRNADFFGGGCTNIWEWYGNDISAGSVATINQGCEMSGGCVTDRLTEFATEVDEHLYSSDFEEATAPYFDWPAFQTQMCMSWFAQTGDDYIHNWNNIVLIEGQDGLFRIMPYSVDINAGLAWGGAWTGMDLWGGTSMSNGCRYDETCFYETIDTCRDLLDQMEILDPANTILEDLYTRLESATAPWGNDGGDGMLRSADDNQYAVAYSFYSTRVEDARAELEGYFYTPVDCGWFGTCDTGGWYETGETGTTDTSDTSVVTDSGTVADTAHPDSGY